MWFGASDVLESPVVRGRAWKRRSPTAQYAVVQYERWSRVRLSPALKNIVFFRRGRAVHQKGAAVNRALAAAGGACTSVLVGSWSKRTWFRPCFSAAVCWIPPPPPLTHPQRPCSPAEGRRLRPTARETGQRGPHGPPPAFHHTTFPALSAR